VSAKMPMEVVDIGGSLYYYSTGDLDSGAKGQTDIMLVLNASKKILEYLSLGINAKYLHSSLFGNLSASTLMFDAGALAEFEYFNLGVSILNMNGSLNYGRGDENIPIVTRFGAMAHNDNDNIIGLAGGLDYVTADTENFIRLGGEISYNKLIAARTGYETGSSKNNGFSLGIGLMLEQIQIDYAFTAFTQIRENVHKIGLTYKFPQAEPYSKPEPKKEVKKQTAERKNIVFDGWEDTPVLAKTSPPQARADNTIVQKPVAANVAAPVNTQPKVAIGNLYFSEGISELGPNMKKYLAQQAAIVKGSKFDKIYIDGHADKTEADSANLSLARAKSAAKYLTSQGIPSERIAIRGLGATKPFGSSATPEGRKINRTVRFSVK